MTKEEKKFVEMPTLTIYPTRKKGISRRVLIIGSVIMILGLVMIVLGVISVSG